MIVEEYTWSYLVDFSILYNNIPRFKFDPSKLAFKWDLTFLIILNYDLFSHF